MNSPPEDPDASGLSKSERAYQWLREQISSGRFAPGHRLVLAPISFELQMSVVPVREAIRRLEAEGLVTVERNVGAQVALVDEQQYVETMQTLGLVEGAATMLSAPKLTESDLSRAEQVNAAMTELLDHFDPQRFTQLNKQFHSILFTPCPNLQILDLVHRGWSRLANMRESIFGFVPDRARHSVSEHSEILRLIRTGADPLALELAAREHRLRTLNAFLGVRHPDGPGAEQDSESPGEPETGEATATGTGAGTSSLPT